MRLISALLVVSLLMAPSVSEASVFGFLFGTDNPQIQAQKSAEKHQRDMAKREMKHEKDMAKRGVASQYQRPQALAVARYFPQKTQYVRTVYHTDMAIPRMTRIEPRLMSVERHGSVTIYHYSD